MLTTPLPAQASDSDCTPLPEKNVFSTADVAEICRVTIRTVNNWIDSGQLMGHHSPDSQEYQIPREYLEQFLAENGMSLRDSEHAIDLSIDIAMLGRAEILSSEISTAHSTSFTTEQVARICRVTPRTVRGWIESGQLKGHHAPDSHDYQIPHEYLERFLEEHELN
jgi:DNA-binding transcriptional MerR regulator